MYSRRDFLRAGAVAAGALSFGPALWRNALAGSRPGPGPYGPLQPPDANGIMLPAGFSSREIARGNAPVPGIDYVWHQWSDGAATFPAEDGGWILVCNSEVPPDVGVPLQEQLGGGGASALRFRSDGTVADGYRVLRDTSTNCSGGPTPWGTWLSCEEHDKGMVWECDPLGVQPQTAYPAMGVFEHESAAVDGAGKRVYLSEDRADGGFYRYTPDRWPDLSSGLLEAATVHSDGLVTWARVPDPSGSTMPVREQVPERTQFARGEGLWFDAGYVYLSTTNDSKVHEFDTRNDGYQILYDGVTISDPALTRVDNLTASPLTGDIFVCEDNSEETLDIGIISVEGEVSRFLTVTGTQHTQSELAGVCFNPAGDRMYFSSQRAFGPGVTYEITGPFRTQRPADGRARSRAKVRAVRVASHEGVLKRGLTASVLGAPPGARVSVRLRATLRKGPRARPVTLARASGAMPADGRRLDVDLRPGRSMRRRLRKRRLVNARLVAFVSNEGRRERLPRRRVRLRSRRRGRRR